MDWISQDDDGFDAQLTQAHTWLLTPANAGKGGFSSTEVDNLAQRKAGWDPAFAAVKMHRQNGLPLTATKNTARDLTEPLLRAMGEQMQARRKLGTITDADLLAFGAKLRDTTPTNVPPPTTRPVLQLGASQRLEHRASWTDESTPGSRKRPAGTSGLELRIAVLPHGQPAPANPDDYNYYRVTDPASPNLVGYDPADAAKTSHAIGRWLSTRGEPGPWSVVVSGTIQG